MLTIKASLNTEGYQDTLTQDIRYTVPCPAGRATNAKGQNALTTHSTAPAPQGAQRKGK